MKLNEIQQNILLNAIDTYGTKHQKIQAIEELNELSQAICKSFRNDIQENRLNIIDEIADVEIMINQLKIIMKIEEIEVQNRVNFKVNRLRERLKQ